MNCYSGFLLGTITKLGPLAGHFFVPEKRSMLFDLTPGNQIRHGGCRFGHS